jgi:hypothetical protein
MTYNQNYDAWLEGPYTDAECECEDRCHLCDRELADAWHWSMDPRV